MLIGVNWDMIKEIKAPIVPQKKEHTDAHKSELKLHTIFGEKRSPFSGELDMKDISSFNMKRVDLLHELNEETFNTFKVS